MRISLPLVASSLLFGLIAAIPIQSDHTILSRAETSAPVEVHLEQSAPHSTVVKVKVTNRGSKDLNIFKQSDLLTEATLRKLDVLYNDKPVDFHGIRVQFDRNNLKDKDFEVLKPGKSIERTIDVAEMHDLTKGGDYVIAAKGFLDIMAPSKTDDKAGARKFGQPLFYKSNSLKMHVDGKAAAKVKRDVHNLYKRMQQNSDCSGDQAQTVQAAMANCAKVASAGAAGAQQGSASFQAYFKTTDQQTMKSVADRLTAIAQECQAANGGITTLHCIDDSGDPKGCTDRAIAFTYGLSGPPDVYLCPSFYTFSATPSQCGVNDQASTLVHELAHNTKVFSPGATDIPGGYGTQATLGMDTQTAIQNADSYSFFAASEVLGCQGGGGGSPGSSGSGGLGPGSGGSPGSPGSGGGMPGSPGSGGMGPGSQGSPGSGGMDPGSPGSGGMGPGSGGMGPGSSGSGGMGPGSGGMGPGSSGSGGMGPGSGSSGSQGGGDPYANGSPMGGNPASGSGPQGGDPYANGGPGAQGGSSDGSGGQAPYPNGGSDPSSNGGYPYGPSSGGDGSMGGYPPDGSGGMYPSGEQGIGQQDAGYYSQPQGEYY